MKLIVQIPCYNEEGCLQATLRDIPRKIPGIDEIEFLVIDDVFRDMINKDSSVANMRRIFHESGQLSLFGDEEDEFLDCYCGRCDKVAGDVQAGLAVESGLKGGEV